MQALVVRCLVIVGVVGLLLAFYFQKTRVLNDLSGQEMLLRYSFGLPDSWIVWERTPTSVNSHVDFLRWSFAGLVVSVFAFSYAIRLRRLQKPEQKSVEAGRRDMPVDRLGEHRFSRSQLPKF